MFDDLWSEIQDMPGEIFDITDEDRDQMITEWEKEQEENETPGSDLYEFDDQSNWLITMTINTWHSEDYDVNEKQTSIDNMTDSLWEALQSAGNRDNVGDAKAIHDEWIVDGKDPEDGEYVFLFLENFAINSWCQSKPNLSSLCNS